MYGMPENLRTFPWCITVAYMVVENVEPKNSLILFESRKASASVAYRLQRYVDGVAPSAPARNADRFKSTAFRRIPPQAHPPAERL